jgi:hypothetical protein
MWSRLAKPDTEVTCHRTSWSVGERQWRNTNNGDTREKGIGDMTQNKDLEIKYTDKNTAAGTQYLNIEEDNLMELISWMIRTQSAVAQMAQLNDTESAQFLDYYWNKRNRAFPVGKRGINTPGSFLAGVIHNLLYGQQRDLTEIQKDALVILSDELSNRFGFTRLRFSIQLFA